ncbi:hypothetical protein BJY59DRAFT_186115 [Rhodotorula toruloides]
MGLRVNFCTPGGEGASRSASACQFLLSRACYAQLFLTPNNVDSCSRYRPPSTRPRRRLCRRASSYTRPGSVNPPLARLAPTASGIQSTREDHAGTPCGSKGGELTRTARSHRRIRRGAPAACKVLGQAGDRKGALPRLDRRGRALRNQRGQRGRRGCHRSDVGG